ncbi:hypothetical protein [Allomuricauda sp. NBRC 101325]|uniref:hypothetical protein n=1 Tax=Allomuricauda sp. NBRC 101325 TaxID=1113758 RepID=UPI0024A5080E|nr:hypothetical protein [Muricauda sp. NBRC 101325]GLU44403.1 hypothetical protein Musp01_20270 [Muricauda sp. NBRC 101325]
MKSIFKIVVFCCAFLFVSCLGSGNKEADENPKLEDFNTVTVNADYQISIPKYMRGSTGLNEAASLQYQNALKETYTIIINEPKEEFVEILKELQEYNVEASPLQNYRAIQLQLLASTMNIHQKTEPESGTIHGLESESVEIYANVEGVDEEIAYLLTFIDGGEDVFMIMSWTLKSYAHQYRKTFEMIAGSFMPIKN